MESWLVSGRCCWCCKRPHLITLHLFFSGHYWQIGAILIKICTKSELLDSFDKQFLQVSFGNWNWIGSLALCIHFACHNSRVSVAIVRSLNQAGCLYASFCFQLKSFQIFTKKMRWDNPIYFPQCVCVSDNFEAFSGDSGRSIVLIDISLIWSQLISSLPSDAKI